jgi:hypothetical protein
VAAAVAVSIGFGAVLTYTSTSLLRAGGQQEAFAGLVSMVAVAFVTWMIFWMRRAARHLKAQLHGRLDAALALGGVALVLTAFLAVGREGLATVLFLWSAVQATGQSNAPLVGIVAGLGLRSYWATCSTGARWRSIWPRPKAATTATDSNCEVAATSLAVDRTTFAVTNKGLKSPRFTSSRPGTGASGRTSVPVRRATSRSRWTPATMTSPASPR